MGINSGVLARLAEYREAERALAQQVAAFEELRASEELKKAIAFDAELDDFLSRHKMSRAALLEFLSAGSGDEGKAPRPAQGRRSPTFKTRTYNNPHTGETITIKLGNNAKFKAWCDKYGRDVVDGWLIQAT